jgi:hypothetical protein
MNPTYTKIVILDEPSVVERTCETISSELGPREPTDLERFAPAQAEGQRAWLHRNFGSSNKFPETTTAAFRIHLTVGDPVQ